MEKQVIVNIDLTIARKMLRLVGYTYITNETPDEEVFEKVLFMIEKYGAKSTIMKEGE